MTWRATLVHRDRLYEDSTWELRYLVRSDGPCGQGPIDTVDLQRLGRPPIPQNRNGGLRILHRGRPRSVDARFSQPSEVSSSHISRVTARESREGSYVGVAGCGVEGWASLKGSGPEHRWAEVLGIHDSVSVSVCRSSLGGGVADGRRRRRRPRIHTVVGVAERGAYRKGSQLFPCPGQENSSNDRSFCPEGGVLPGPVAPVGRARQSIIADRKWCDRRPRPSKAPVRCNGTTGSESARASAASIDVCPASSASAGAREAVYARARSRPVKVARIRGPVGVRRTEGLVETVVGPSFVNVEMERPHVER